MTALQLLSFNNKLVTTLHSFISNIFWMTITNRYNDNNRYFYHYFAHIHIYECAQARFKKRQLCLTIL